MGEELIASAKRPSPPSNASQENTEHGEAPRPPSPPRTRLIVDRQPDVPALIAVDETTLSLQWSPVSITVRSTQIRVVECLEAYALEMQQVEVNATTSEPDIKEERWSVQYSGPATYVQVKGLRPGRNYAVRVACRPIVTDPEVAIELAAPSEILLVRTPATPPSAPAAPILSVRQRNALKFKWSEPSETGGHPILAYVVQCHPAPEGFEGDPITPEGMYEIYRGLERNVTMKRLSPGIRYSVRVMAINCIGESSFSPIATFSTQATVPSAPEDLVVSSSGKDSVVLEWTAVAGNGADVSGYQVMMDDGQGGDFNFVGHVQEPHFAMTGLRSGLSYRFRVQAENSEGKSLWSPVCLAQTAATAPLAPPPPVREDSTHSSITITWRPPEFDGGSPLLGYEVEMQPKSEMAKRERMDNANWMQVYSGKGTSYIIESLRAGCTYKVRVRAINSIGAGAYSFPADVVTSPASPEAPEAPVAANRTQHALLVQWDAPQHDGGAPIVSYRLRYRVAGPVEQPSSDDITKSASTGEDNDGAFRVVYDGAERRAEIQGLDPGMKYEFRVNASNKQGTSSWSPTAVVTTKAGPPLSPAAPTVVHGSAARSLDLSWKRPYGQGAHVDSYIVQMRTAVADEEQHALPTANGNGVGNGIQAQESADEGVAPSERSTSSAVDDALFTTVYHSSETHCTVTDLEPNCEYLFRMRAFNPVGASPWSSIISAHTAAASPSAPENLHCAQASESNLTLAWEPPKYDHGAAITVYQLEVAPASRGQRATEKAAWRSLYKGSTLQCSVNDLQPGQQYCARVRAQNVCGWGPWSEVLTSSTQAAVPGPPEAPSASGRTGTSVRLSWSPPSESNGSSVTEYELQMAAQGDDDQAEESQHWSTLVNGLDTTWKVSQLSPGSKYSFRVRASNAVGAGLWSPLTAVETALLPPLEPKNIEIAPAEEATGAVSINWTPPETAEQRANCIGYEIECIPAGKPTTTHGKTGGGGGGSAKSAAATSVVKHTCSSKATDFKLVGLKEGKWTVHLRAIGADGAGHGGWSPAATVHIVGHVVMHHGSDSDGALGAAATVVNGGGGGQQGRQRKQRRRSLDTRDTSSVGSGHSEDVHYSKGHTRGQARGTKTAVAKAKPRPKTFLSALAKAAGMSDSSFKSLLWVVFGLMVAVAVLLMVTG